MSNKQNDKLVDDAKDAAIECPNCKELAWVVIYSDYKCDEFECEECMYYGVMGR